MKIALLQCNTVTGDIAGNLVRIADAVRQAGDADLCVTPELALSGVTPGNFLSMNDFIGGCSRALDTLASQFSKGPAILVGAPVASVYSQRLLSNAAVLVRDGAWSVVSVKVRPESSADPDARFFDRGISCGIINVAGFRIGVVLCEGGASESFWEPQGTGHSPLKDLLSRGVDAIVNMAAVPCYLGSASGTDAETVLAHVAALHHVHVFYANAVGGNGGDVYAGASFAVDQTGAVSVRGRAFEEDVVLADTGRSSEAPAPDAPVWADKALRALVLGTRDFVLKSGLTRAVVGLSGGMDSALVLAVAADALGSENVTAVLMPSQFSSRGSVDDAVKLAENLGVQYRILPIEDVKKQFEATLAPAMEMFPTYQGDTTFENLQARIRGTLVMSIANRARALVLNTGNKSEGAMGYSTLYGDTVGALGVIADLTKTQVYAVAAQYNAAKGREVIPQAIFDKAPSAELRPDQKDSDSLPPYDELDPVIETLLCAEPRTPLGDMGPRAGEIRRKLFGAEFKRRQEPQPLYISERPFGRAWSVPLGARFRLPE